MTKSICNCCNVFPNFDLKYSRYAIACAREGKVFESFDGRIEANFSTGNPRVVMDRIDDAIFTVYCIERAGLFLSNGVCFIIFSIFQSILKVSYDTLRATIRENKIWLYFVIAQFFVKRIIVYRQYVGQFST